MIEAAGFKRLDTPRKCIEWAKEAYKWDEDQARENLGLPEKSAKPAFVPGGPFVSTGNAELDALLLSLTVPGKALSEAPAVDTELDVANVRDDWWHWREQARFDKTINKRPRIAPAFVKKHIGGSALHHFVHCSREEPGKIIYTPDQDYGKTDRRVLTSVGKYLTKHYEKTFNEAKIKAIAEEHKALYADAVVLFALGADEIVWVYDHGFDTCMSKKQWPFENPVRIYDGPDTAVAYIMNKEKRVCARAVVNIANTPMTYSRVFGDEALLTSRLSSLGFANVLGLKGARLRLAFDPNTRMAVCPYIDHNKNVSLEGEFLVVEGKGEAWPCLQTSGYPNMRRLELHELPASVRKAASAQFTCSICERRKTQPEGHELRHNGGPLCTECLTKNFVSAAVDRSDTRGWIRTSEGVQVEGRWYYTGNEALMKSLGLFGSGWSGKWLPIGERVPMIGGGFMGRSEGVETVTGKWASSGNCVRDPEGRQVYCGHAGSLLDPGGKMVYFHPEFLPACVTRHKNGFKLVDIKEKETA